MKTIGMFEVKTHLSEILKGSEEICITNRGKKIAIIVPIEKYRRDNNANIFKALFDLKNNSPLGSLQDISDMRKKGQR